MQMCLCVTKDLSTQLGDGRNIELRNGAPRRKDAESKNGEGDLQLQAV